MNSPSDLDPIPRTSCAGYAPGPLTYERSIADAAERHGWTVAPDGDFVRVSDGNSSARHWVLGPARDAYNTRAQHSLCRGDKA